MKNKDQIQMEVNSGYPMCFKIKDKVLRPHEDRPQHFYAERNVDVAVLEEIKVGQVILFRNAEHIVVGATEPRPCKGSHPKIGVIFQSLRTEFIDAKIL